MNDYVVIIKSPDYPGIYIEFKIPHSRTSEVVTYLTQFDHEVVRPNRSDEIVDGVAPEGCL